MSNPIDTTNTGRTKSGFPKSIPFIVGNEAAERFSFYGMKSILTTFLAATFFATQDNPTAHANEMTHLFIGLVYLTPMIGAVLADWFFGKYRIILYVSLMYCVGHACLAMFEGNYPGFMLGLLFIAVGAGGIKPCVSANVGDQFNKSNEHLISKAFDMFYFSINFGSFFSTLLIPYLNKNYGPAVAFGVPGILMALATFIFWLGRKKYVKVPPSGFANEEFYTINFYCLFHTTKDSTERKNYNNPILLLFPILAGFAIFLGVVLIDYHMLDNPFVILLPISGMAVFFIIIGLVSLIRRLSGERFYDVAARKFKTEQIEAVKSVWKVLVVFAFIPFFWALYDQNGSEWVLQAADPNMDLNFMGIQWLPEQVQAINPILILAFIPLFSVVLYPLVEKMGIKVTPLRKIGVGFVFTALSFLLIYFIQVRLDAGEKVNIVWQLWAYAILTAGEVLISITGLEYAYTMAPKTMKSTLMSFWLLTVSLGNILVTLINNNIKDNGFFAQFHGSGYYLLFLGIICGVFLIYIVVSKLLKEGQKIVQDLRPEEP